LVEKLIDISVDIGQSFTCFDTSKIVRLAIKTDFYIQHGFRVSGFGYRVAPPHLGAFWRVVAVGRAALRASAEEVVTGRRTPSPPPPPSRSRACADIARHVI